MSLHPEVEKEIEAGPQLVPRSEAMATKIFTHTQESPQAFARRIAALAVEKEREWLVNRCGQLAAFHRAGEDDPKEREEIAYALELLAKEISGRGKP